MEPYQMVNDIAYRLEKEAEKILRDCPTCPECQRYVDIYGVDPWNDDNKYIEDDYYGTFHRDCYKKFLWNHFDRIKELAVMAIEEFLLRDVNMERINE